MQVSGVFNFNYATAKLDSCPLGFACTTLAPYNPAVTSMKIRPLPMTEGFLKIRVNALVMKHSGQL